MIVNPDQARLMRSELLNPSESARRTVSPAERMAEDLSKGIPKAHCRFELQSYYPKTYLEWNDVDLLQQATSDNTSIRIERGKQRGKLYVNGRVAMDFPVSTGRASYETPLGRYRILDKKREHISNIYGVSMPCFMRLTYSGIGLHVGNVCRYPASHGCIRLTRTACEPIFKLVRVGTPVEIVD